MKRSISSAERAHMKEVAQMPCAVCKHCLGASSGPVELHHVKTRCGWGRSSHYFVLPLCALHHRGSNYSVHGMGRDEFASHFGYSEMSLLRMTLEQVGRKDLIDEVNRQLTAFTEKRSIYKKVA